MIAISQTCHMPLYVCNHCCCSFLKGEEVRKRFQWNTTLHDVKPTQAYHSNRSPASGQKLQAQPGAGSSPFDILIFN